jgi:putative transport protein
VASGLGLAGCCSAEFLSDILLTKGLVLSAEMLHFIQEFGLILFVYTIGIQVGPGFFASLRVSGLRLNLFALGIVVMGGLVTAILHKLFDIPLPWCWVSSPARSPTRLRWVRGSKFCAIWVSNPLSTRWG